MNESGLYSFLDENQGILLHFFDGQKLISDLAITTGLSGKSFAAFRDISLGVQLLISFLKDGANFGFYIDNSEPQFLLKIETNSEGLTRSLLMPSSLDKVPEKLNGVLRIVRSNPKEKQPYTSIIELKNTQISEVINKAMLESFQIDGRIEVSQVIDQSLMLSRVPGQTRRDLIAQKHEEEGLGINEYFFKNRDKINALLKEDFQDENKIKDFIASKFHMVYLDKQAVKFYCSCDKDRMIANVKNLLNLTEEELFDEGENVINLTCDYCLTNYEITKKELGL